MTTISLIPDDDIAEVAITKNDVTKNFSIIDFNPDKKFDHEIVVTPHYMENYGNVIFWKLKLFCEKNNIKLTSFGLLNQLPVFSIFSDKMILQNRANLGQIYQGPSMVGAEKDFINLLTNAEYSEVRTMWKNHILVMNPPKNSRKYKMLQKSMPYYVAAAKEISDEQVAERFSNLNVFIRESSLKLFHKLKIPKNLIVCEFKTCLLGQQKVHLYPVHKWIVENKDKFIYPLVGINRNFQKKMLSGCGNHYMSIQILASLLNNWQFMCQGGSANLMSILPVKSLLFNEQWINPSASVRNILRMIYRNRLGAIGETIPTICPIPEIEKNPKKLLLDINMGIVEWSKISAEIVKPSLIC